MSFRTQDVVLSKRGFWFDFLTAPALLPREGGKRKPRGKTRDEQERAAREYPVCLCQAWLHFAASLSVPS